VGSSHASLSRLTTRRGAAARVAPSVRRRADAGQSENRRPRWPRATHRGRRKRRDMPRREAGSRRDVPRIHSRVRRADVLSSGCGTT